MRTAELHDLFCRLHEDVERQCGRLILAFGFGPEEHYPKPRNYAYYVEPQHGHAFGTDGQTGLILVSRKMLSATNDRIEAILRHELGHAMDLQAERTPELLPFLSGDSACLVRGNERRADALAYSLWGSPIFYDRCTLQSLTTGVYPRPTFLGE